MDDVREEFRKVVERPYEKAARWKRETGRKVIGCHPMYVPEEIVHAAGALPVVLLGSGETVTLAHRYLQPSFVCLPIRCNLDLALKGKLDFLDGVIFPDICDEARSLSDIWKAHREAPFHYSLMLPANLSTPLAGGYLAAQLADLRVSLERFLGHEIADESLRGSIAAYNRNRALLSRLYEVRRGNPGLLRARNAAEAVAASMLMPKEEHSELLSRLLEGLGAAEKPPDGMPRLLLSGGLCDMPDMDILDLVEELGAVVVDDDLYVGSRYFATQVEEGISPLDALAARYIGDVPCPTKFDPQSDWGEYLVDMARRSGADGVVIMMAEFCAPHGFDYPHLKEKLSAAGVPHLLLTTDHTGPSGQMKTRLGAFIELLERR